MNTKFLSNAGRQTTRPDVKKGPQRQSERSGSVRTESTPMPTKVMSYRIGVKDGGLYVSQSPRKVPSK